MFESKRQETVGERKNDDQDDDLAYYVPKEKQVISTLRAPEGLHEELKEIADLWHQVEQRVGEGKVSLNDVLIRLLRVGVDGVWTELGGRPTTDKAKQALVERMVAAHEKARAASSNKTEK